MPSFGYDCEINKVRLASFAGFQNYEKAVPKASGITDVWRAVEYDNFDLAIAKFFIQTRLMDSTEAFEGASPKPDNYEEVVKTLQIIAKELLDYDEAALISPARPLLPLLWSLCSKQWGWPSLGNNGMPEFCLVWLARVSDLYMALRLASRRSR